MPVLRWKGASRACRKPEMTGWAAAGANVFPPVPIHHIATLLSDPVKIDPRMLFLLYKYEILL